MQKAIDYFISCVSRIGFLSSYVNLFSMEQ